jgi:hypothetical protein
VVSRLSAGRVEVWGQVRPANGRVPATITISPGGGQPFAAAARVTTNDAGYFRVRMRRRGAARLLYRIEWTSPSGPVLRSRVARAGRPIRYLRDTPKPAAPKKAKPKRR